MARNQGTLGSRAKAEFWNQQAAGWERWESALQYLLGSVDPVLFRALELEPGHRVVDIGCGSGDPALAIAKWVGPRGHVLGIDLAGAMLRVARSRARLLGLGNLTFRRGDMTRFRAGGARFDRVVSRFGLMFARDVPGVLEQLRSCLKPRGRIALVVWGPMEKNPAYSLRAEAVRPFLDQPPPDPEQIAHPMRFARRGVMAGLLKRAGFREVEGEGVPVSAICPSLDEYVEMQVETSLAETYVLLTRADQSRLKQRLRRRFRRFEDGAVVRVPGFAWVVSGRR